MLKDKGNAIGMITVAALWLILSLIALVLIIARGEMSVLNIILNLAAGCTAVMFIVYFIVGRGELGFAVPGLVLGLLSVAGIPGSGAFLGGQEIMRGLAFLLLGAAILKQNDNNTKPLCWLMIAYSIFCWLPVKLFPITVESRIMTMKAVSQGVNVGLIINLIFIMAIAVATIVYLSLQSGLSFSVSAKMKE